MFLHEHPYKPFISENTTKLIVGTLPPPRFSMGKLKAGDVNFCYGSIDGLLWPVLDKIFNLKLKFETTSEAIKQRKDFLKSRNIGVCDIVASAERDKIDASDIGMQNPKFRNVIRYIKEYPKIDTLIFTGGNSKNGPEYFFRQHLKTFNLKLQVVSKEVPRIHEFFIPSETSKDSKLDRIIKTISLTAPSGAANRAIGSMDLYKQLKNKNSNFNTFDFRVMQYRDVF